MPVIRRLLAHPRLVVLICAVALLLKVLVPTGYMISDGPGGPAITICSGMKAAPGVSIPGDLPDQGRSEDQGKVGVPCPFASLSALSLAAIDPVLLVHLLVFIMVVGFAATVAGAAPARVRLRPPLRAPPTHL